MKFEVGDTALIAIAALVFAAGVVYFLFIRKPIIISSVMGQDSSLIHSFQGVPGPSPPPPVTDIRAMRRLPPQV